MVLNNCNSNLINCTELLRIFNFRYEPMQFTSHNIPIDLYLFSALINGTELL